MDESDAGDPTNVGGLDHSGCCGNPGGNPCGEIKVELSMGDRKVSVGAATLFKVVCLPPNTSVALNHGCDWAGSGPVGGRE